MKNRVVAIILALIALSSCEETVVEFANSGKLTLSGVNYGVTQARYNIDSLVDGEYHAQLTFSPKRISITDAGMSGGGASYLYLSMLMPSSEFLPMQYDVRQGQNLSIQPMKSYFETISEDKKDTTRVLINGGSIDYSMQGDTMPYFTFNLDTETEGLLTGDYIGTLIENRSIDTDSLGYFIHDTVETSLGEANIWNWENLFDETLFYYEIEMLSTDMRFKDDGKMKNGTVLFLGVFTDNAIFPVDGVYEITERPKNFGFYVGYKINNTYWGSYWNEIKNATTIGKANITGGKIELTKIDGDTYKIVLDMKDQLNKDIDGVYKGMINERNNN